MELKKINPVAWKRFGNLIKKEREKQNLSIEECANMINIPVEVFAKLENGEDLSWLTINDFFTIIMMLNLPEKELITIYQLATYKYKNMEELTKANKEQMRKDNIKKIQSQIQDLNKWKNKINQVIQGKENMIQAQNKYQNNPCKHK